MQGVRHKMRFIVGWSEARSPTAVMDQAPHVGRRASAPTYKKFYGIINGKG